MKQMVCLIVLAVMFAVNVSAKMKKEVIIFSQPCRFCDLLKKDLNENLDKNSNEELNTKKEETN